nr:ABC transporter ATP-binding protein [Ardenticatena sp.]
MDAIRFEHVSKKFILRHEDTRSWQQRFVDFLSRRSQGHGHDEFWVLRDVSFSVPFGRTVGIIGPNGSGKSTALKMVAGILQPTEGVIEVNGRVAALLELGAGFHPELTGRENIYLNGSLLGFSRDYIDERFASIVEFAELGRFIDTPIKNYSSGMKARLGFAIAAHVDADILVIDEVLAVGDERFQRRCLDLLRIRQTQGKTILMVSHNLGQMVEFCSHAIWLQEGEVRALGSIEDVVRAYVDTVNEREAQELLKRNEAIKRMLSKDAEKEPQKKGEKRQPTIQVEEPLSKWARRYPVEVPDHPPPRRWGNGPIKITNVEIRNAEGETTWSVESLAPVEFVIEYEAIEPVEEPIFSVLIHKLDGHYLWASNTYDNPVDPILAPGSGRVRVKVPVLALPMGRYYLSAACYPESQYPRWQRPSDFHQWLYTFQVVSDLPAHGDVAMPVEWRHEAPHMTAAYSQASSE